MKPVLFKAYIGPRPVMPGAAENYGKWDWMSSVGTLYAPLPYTGRWTLSGSLPAGSAGPMPPIFGVPTLPAAAGLWVGGNGPNETWEYIAYHSNRNELLREDLSPNTGLHSIGAPVYFWYPLDTNSGDFEIVQEATDNMTAHTWTAKLSGITAPSMVLKPEHLIAITWRDLTLTDSTTPPAVDPADFPLFCLGYVDRVEMVQNGTRRGTWNIDIVCTAKLVQESTVPPLRLGPLNIALEASAEASSSLGAAWKLTLPQRDANPEQIDIVEPQQDLGPENIVDDNPDTLWVSDGWRGPNATNAHGHGPWASIFAYPPHGNPFGLRYIEIMHAVNMHLTWYYVFQKYSTSDGTGRKGWIQAVEKNFFDDNGFETDTISGNDQSVVLAENGTIFKNVFPASDPEQFMDALTFDGQDVEAVRRVWYEGGALFMGWEDIGGGLHSDRLISWGNVTHAEMDDIWESTMTSDFDLPSGSEHIAHIPLASLKPGAVMRIDLGNPTLTYVVDYRHHPGYLINNDDEIEWLKFQIPPMTHILRDDIIGGDTEIFLRDAQGNPNVEGISIHGQPGAIFIDDEFISFTGKDYEQGKLTGLTVARPHKAGTKVYVLWQTFQTGSPNNIVPRPEWGAPPDMKAPFEDKLFDMATDGYPLERIEWGRGFYANGDVRYPYIGSFILRFGVGEEVRDSTQNSFEDDYLTHPTLDSNSFTPAINTPNASLDLTVAPFINGGAFRPRSILMQIREMRNDAGANVVERPRLNYFRAFVDRRFFNPATWLDTAAGDGWANELLTLEVLRLSGWWGSLFSSLGGPVENQQARQRGIMDTDSAWRVAVDNCEFGNSVLLCRRNGRIQVTTNNYLAEASHTPSRSFDTYDATEMEIVNVRPAQVGQVRLAWQTGSSTTLSAVLYPDDRPKGSALVELGPYIANNEPTALRFAVNHYRTKRFPYNIFAHLSRADETIEPGEIHQWDYDFEQNGIILRKLLFVESVTHTFSGRNLETVIGYREIDREHV